MRENQQASEYPKYDNWKEIREQMFKIWEVTGKIKANRPPQTPTMRKLFEPNANDIEELNKRWIETESWLRRNDCIIESNNRVTKLPTPKKKPLEINPEDPYACDALGRNKKAGSFLTQLITIQSEPFTLAIDGAWGSGKSALFKMWKPELEKQFDVISFNAWENDFTSDPLIALASDVDIIAGHQKNKQEKIRNLFRVVRNITLSYVSHGAISADDLDLIKAKEEQTIDEWFSYYRSQKKLPQAFRHQLEELAKEAKGEKLVFLIDELDRCRPTYAIKFLERIKHLFMVPGVCFVLAIDREQLGKAIQAVYGQINTEGYLRRFIDLTYKLPAPQYKKFIELLFKEQHLEHYLEGRSNEQGAIEIMTHLLDYFSGIADFGLRDIEHVVRQLVLAARTTPDNILISPFLLTVLACIKLHNEKLYYDFCNGRIKALTVIEKLPTLTEDTTTTGQKANILIKASLYYADPEVSEESIPSNNLSHGEAETIRRVVLNLSKMHGIIQKTKVLQWVYEKLELTNNLVG